MAYYRNFLSSADICLNCDLFVPSLYFSENFSNPYQSVISVCVVLYYFNIYLRLVYILWDDYSRYISINNIIINTNNIITINY